MRSAYIKHYRARGFTSWLQPGSERTGELREEGNQVEHLTAGQVLCLAGHYNYLCDRLHEYTDVKDTSCSSPGSERTGELWKEGNQVEHLIAGQDLCLAEHNNYLCDRALSEKFQKKCFFRLLASRQSSSARRQS